MGFSQSDAAAAPTAQPDIGPTIWPLAMPPWVDVLALHNRRWRAGRAAMFLFALSLHLIAVAALLAYRGTVDLRRMAEQSRLTLVRVATAIGPAPPKNSGSSDTSVIPVFAADQPTAPMEWTKVKNWRPQASGDAVRQAGERGGGDMTSLLAGLGSAGPAGASDGVADPYAGASPIWTGKGTKSRLLLPDAPNPAMLDEIRSYVALALPGLRGRASFIVSVNDGGIIAGVISMESDLPDAALRLLRQSLIGRVVAKEGKRTSSELKLPEIVFG